jgi:hypothetical protein
VATGIHLPRRKTLDPSRLGQNFKLSVPTGQEVRDPHTGQPVSSGKKSRLFLKVETDAGVMALRQYRHDDGSWKGW